MNRMMANQGANAQGPIGMQGGMGMNEHLIAADLLMSAKAGVRNYAYAVTETDTPEVRRILEQHLTQAIRFHDRVSDYMEAKGYYHPHSIPDQIRADLQTAQQVMQFGPMLQ